MIASIRYHPESWTKTDHRFAPEVYIEICEGDVSQIWRARLPTKVEQADIRKELGEALEELGRSIAASHGYPLVPSTNG